MEHIVRLSADYQNHQNWSMLSILKSCNSELLKTLNLFILKRFNVAIINWTTLIQRAFNTNSSAEKMVKECKRSWICKCCFNCNLKSIIDTGSLVEAENTFFEK